MQTVIQYASIVAISFPTVSAEIFKKIPNAKVSRINIDQDCAALASTYYTVSATSGYYGCPALCYIYLFIIISFRL